jgi:superfamily II DNA helicase RecQ
MPTGSGKSLIINWPHCNCRRHTGHLAVDRLMKDQVDSLTRRGMATTFINST